MKDILIDHVEKVAEEIRMFFGYEVKVVDSEIIVSTPIGDLKRKPSSVNQGHMIDFYHFVSYYGIKLHKYGHNNMIDEGRIISRKNQKLKKLLNER